MDDGQELAQGHVVDSPSTPTFQTPLQGSGARREVSELVSQLQLAAEALPLPEDRLLTFVEGAQVGDILQMCHAPNRWLQPPSW